MEKEKGFNLPKNPQEERFIKNLLNVNFLGNIIFRTNLREIEKIPFTSKEFDEQLFKRLGLWHEINQMRIKEIFGSPDELPEGLSSKIKEAIDLYIETLKLFNNIREKRHNHKNIPESDYENVLESVRVLYAYLEDILKTEFPDLRNKFINETIERNERWLEENQGNYKAAWISENTAYLKSKE